jgi:hypothetical protein
MLRRIVVWILVGSSLALAIIPSTSAQDTPNAWTDYRLNMRSGPGKSYAVLVELSPNTALILEARTADSSWVLAQTEDRAYRGWLAAVYLRYGPGTSATALPVSTEIVNAPPQPAAPDPASGRSPSTTTSLGTGINLKAVPAVPVSLGRARAIFLQGRAMGRDPHVISKIGDCHTTSPNFLLTFIADDDLPGYLWPVVDQFGGSFGVPSLAATDGYNTVAALSPDYADPGVCLPDETPIQCEYRVHNSSVAIIMLGTMDLLITTPEEYDHNLRRIVEQTIEAGVIPLLSTFPRHEQYPENHILYNQIVVQVARDYNIPLVNIWSALEIRPNHGLAPDGFHLTPEHGFLGRNITTLEALNAVWVGAMY